MTIQRFLSDHNLISSDGLDAEETISFFINRLNNEGQEEWINAVSTSVELCIELSNANNSFSYRMMYILMVTQFNFQLKYKSYKSWVHLQDSTIIRISVQLTFYFCLSVLR